MKEFEPSPAFVSRVMRAVRVYEESRRPGFATSQLFLSSPFARYALSAAGILAGIAHLARMYLVLFSPVACR